MQKFNLTSPQTQKDIARVSLALLFIAASTLHFISDTELKIIPTFLPWRREALYITGVFELLGGIGLLIPRFQRAAAWGLVALLITVFPANVYHSVKHVQLGGITDYPLYHWIRLPFQAVFICWALWSTSKKRDI
ncbi:MAG TPA: DoxX family protein [Ktedonobacter sp.]|nr:DoxX family protein [Ktedonobacter sp.]